MTDEISNAHGGDLAYFLANETAYPGRVVRAPLTPADIAAGLTGGVVTGIDTTELNIGSTVIETLDMALDWRLHLAHGSLRFNGKATWQPVFRRRIQPDIPFASLVNYFDGPLAWRANGGAEWSSGRLSIALNGQFYSHYRVSSSLLAVNPPDNVTAQGSGWIPAQFSLDLAIAYRIALSSRYFQVRLGVGDLLDARPPTVVDAFSPPYSSYGDPRRRRFELTVATHFQ